MEVAVVKQLPLKVAVLRMQGEEQQRRRTLISRLLGRWLVQYRLGIEGSAASIGLSGRTIITPRQT